MGLPALQHELESGVEQLAKRDWEAEFAKAQNIDQFEAVINASVQEFAAWRRTMGEKVRSSLKVTASNVTAENAQETLDDLDKMIAVISALASSMKQKLGGFKDHEITSLPLTPSQRRYVKKVLKRGDQVGIDMHDFYVDTYYLLLGLRAEIEDRDATPLPTFTDGNALAEYLRKETA